jgi:flavodoxin
MIIEQACKQLFCLEGQMSDQDNKWSDIYRFFSTMDEGKFFMVFFILAGCISAGHDYLHCSASKTEYKSTSPPASSVNNGSRHTQP